MNLLMNIFLILTAVSISNTISAQATDISHNNYHLRRPHEQLSSEVRRVTDGISEGQSVKCLGNDEDIFRWTDGMLHRYPDPVIASSWNAKWRDMITIDCTSLQLSYGSPMKIFLEEGDSVLCHGDSTKVYRWNNGQLRHYPDPTAAASWNRGWRDVVSIDCTNLSFGRPVDEAFFLKEGHSVMCRGDDVNVYRYTNGLLRHHPNPAVATSWDKNWRENIERIDCSPFEIVRPMIPKPENFDIPVLAPFRVGRNTFDGDEIDLVVTRNTDAYAPHGQVKIILSTETDITWWKGIFCGAVGGWEMLGTVGDRHGPTSAYFTKEILNDAVLCKVREFGSHECLYEMELESIGRDLDPDYVYHFRWVRDN